MNNEYIPFDVLAARLGLPKSYLRRLTDEGVLPHLDVNGRLRFVESAVRETLREQATAACSSSAKRAAEGTGA